MVIAKFRAVCVAPGASLALRLKAPPSKRPGAYACGRRANHSIVGLQRRRPRGAANRRERDERLPVQLDLAAHNCLTYRLNLGRTTWRFKEPDGEVIEVPVAGTFQTDNGQALLAATPAH